jgi:3-phenylpropionate/trans-cinnamate dioxygenase ferredoxin reductase component
VNAPRSVVIVGASIAGLTTAESLRRLGYDGRISLIGDEAHHPYDRPPLSKEVLSGKWQPEKAALRRPGQVEALELDLRRGVTATGVELDRHRVLLADGDAVEYGALVVATGLRPRRLPAFAGMAGVHVLRTLDDCLALQAELGPERRVAVIGAGFLGTEIAATARQMGARVSLVDVVTEPLTLQLGPELGQLVADLHADHGVDVRVGVGASEVRAADGRVSGIVLSDGTQLDTDLVVLAIGTVPATEWLEGSGLDLTGGLLCDAACRAAADVFAAGDVARWPHETVGGLLRVESRTNAVEQAQLVARNIIVPVDEAEGYRPVSFGWTDQYDVKIQIYGHRSPVSDFVLLEGSPAEGKFIGAFRHNGTITGVVGWNSARALRGYRDRVFTTADPELEPYHPDLHRDNEDEALAGLG